MKQKMRNTLCIYIYGIDLTKCSNIKFYMQQDSSEFPEYNGIAYSKNQLIVEIPYDDAMKLSCGTVEAQVCMQDEFGNSRATNVMTIPVEELIAKNGYN